MRGGSYHAISPIPSPIWSPPKVWIWQKELPAGAKRFAANSPPSARLVFPAASGAEVGSFVTRDQTSVSVGTGTFTSEPWERGRLGLRWRGRARAAQFSLSLPRRPQGSHPASFYWAPQAHTCLPSALFVLPGFSPCTPLAQPPKPHPQVGQSLLGCPAPLSFCPIRRTHPQPACLSLHHSWV